MNGESIYKYINRMAIENPGLPYTFQDPYIAGRIDINYVLWGDDLPFLHKERLALELVDYVADCIDEQIDIEELGFLLQERPVLWYMGNFNSRMKTYISEGLIDAKKLYILGMELATQSEEEELVKLGMLFLGYFENDVTRQILKTLGLHSAFTLYALEAARNFTNYNKFIYELAQNTLGFGKLAALYVLEPVHQRQKEWLFENGMTYGVVPDITAIICLEKVEMAVFYQNLTMTEENFSRLSRLIAYGFENNDIKEFSQGLTLVEKYLKAAPRHAKTFIDLASIVIIEDNMIPSWMLEYIDIEDDYEDWPMDRQELVIDICNGLIGHSKWDNIVFYELSQPQEETSLIVSVLERLELLPTFETFIPLLERDLFDMDLLEYLLIENAEYYLEDVFYYITHMLLDTEVFEGPQAIFHDDLTFEHRPDIWVLYLLKEMVEENINQEEFFVDCLSARFSDVRIEAIHALRQIRRSWSNQVIPALEHAYEAEPVESIKKQLWTLINWQEGEEGKEQWYLDIPEPKVIPWAFDIVILDTSIAGTLYRDLTLVEDQVEAGDILFLLREPTNEHDENAIVVTDKYGYALGYIPKSDNRILASMMDAGERLYAILVSESLEDRRPEIKVMLSKRMEREEELFD